MPRNVESILSEGYVTKGSVFRRYFDTRRLLLCIIFALLAYSVAEEAYGQTLFESLAGDWKSDNSVLTLHIFKRYSDVYAAQFSTTPELAMDHTTQDGANLVMRGRDAVECYYYADVDQNKLKLDLRRPSDSQYCPRESIFTKRLITNVRPANPTLTGEASINNFVSRKNRDIYGHDIPLANGQIFLSGQDINGCAAECNRMAACVAFSFDNWKGKCFLKDEVPDSIIDPRSAIYVKKPGELPNVSTKEADIERVHRRRFRGNVIDIKTASNFSACEATCKEDIHCIAFTVLRGVTTNNCKKFKEVAGYDVDDNADGGYKYQQP